MSSTNKPDDGGPAFPVPPDFAVDSNGTPIIPGSYGYGPMPGMSLRDYFAAQAMQALITDRAPLDLDHEYKHVAWRSFQMADAMLDVRTK